MTTPYEIPKGISDAKSKTNDRIGSHMFIVVGPSGTGKSTLLNHLMTARQDCRLSRSATTRAPRGQERDGVEYDFISVAEFEERIKRNEFAEFASVFGNYYGTPHAMIEANVSEGFNVLFDIDVQGARLLKTHYPLAWCVLVAPPSMKVLEARLRGRKTDAPEVIERRLKTAQTELAQTDLFDFCVINDDLQTAKDRLLAIYDVLALRAAH